MHLLEIAQQMPKHLKFKQGCGVQVGYKITTAKQAKQTLLFVELIARLYQVDKSGKADEQEFMDFDSVIRVVDLPGVANDESAWAKVRKWILDDGAEFHEAYIRVAMDKMIRSWKLCAELSSEWSEISFNIEQSSYGFEARFPIVRAQKFIEIDWDAYDTNNESESESLAD